MERDKFAMSQSIKTRVYEIVEKASEGDRASHVFDLAIQVLIFLNVVVVILESVKSIDAKYQSLFWVFEIVSVFIFTVEYLLRLWACTSDSHYQGTFGGRVRFALTPLALIDLVAILPFYLFIFFPVNIEVVRVLRMLRLLRIFKLGRYSKSLRTIGRVLNKKKQELFMSAFVGCVLLILASSFMYVVENPYQPDSFSSIPAAMWWGAATLTTVGYGDIYPVTPIGKMLGAIIALLGVSLFALPAGILGSGFVEEIHRRKGNKDLCPHCGKFFRQSPDS